MQMLLRLACSVLIFVIASTLWKKIFWFWTGQWNLQNGIVESWGIVNSGLNYDKSVVCYYDVSY